VTIERIAVYRARSGGLVTEKVCRRLTVQNFTSAENEFDGLAAYQTENSVFSELHLHDNPFAGISLDIDFNNNIISGAVITDNDGPGIFMRDSRDNLFSDIQIRNSGEKGLFLAQVGTDVTTPAMGNTFHGLVVSNSVQEGMRVNDASCVNNLVVAAQFIDNQSCISEQMSGLVEQVGIICR
jgi:parallel beta-helix repeat protein